MVIPKMLCLAFISFGDTWTSEQANGAEGLAGHVEEIGLGHFCEIS